jgi:hypothetical protein
MFEHGIPQSTVIVVDQNFNVGQLFLAYSGFHLLSYIVSCRSSTDLRLSFHISRVATLIPS